MSCLTCSMVLQINYSCKKRYIYDDNCFACIAINLLKEIKNVSIAKILEVFMRVIRAMERPYV